MVAVSTAAGQGDASAAVLPLPSPSSFYHDLNLATTEIGTPTLAHISSWLPPGCSIASWSSYAWNTWRESVPSPGYSRYPLSSGRTRPSPLEALTKMRTAELKATAKRKEAPAAETQS